MHVANTVLLFNGIVNNEIKKISTVVNCRYGNVESAKMVNSVKIEANEEKTVRILSFHSSNFLPLRSPKIAINWLTKEFYCR